MKRIYICSPYAGDIETNVKNAHRYCLFVAVCGNNPVTSHLLYPQFLNDDSPSERQLGCWGLICCESAMSCGALVTASAMA